MKKVPEKPVKKAVKKAVPAKGASIQATKKAASASGKKKSVTAAPAAMAAPAAVVKAPEASVLVAPETVKGKPWGWISLVLIAMIVLVSAEVVYLLKSKIDLEYEMKVVKTIGERNGEPETPGRFWGPMLVRVSPESKQLGLVDINFKKVLFWDYETSALKGEVKAAVVQDEKFSPNSMCFDPQGNVLVTDAGQMKVYKVSPDLKVLAAWEVKSPVDVATNSKGEVLVIRGEDCDVMQYDAEGKNPRSLISGRLRKPIHLACDEENNIYILDIVQKAILVFSPEGKFERSWNIKADSLSVAAALAVRNGNVYFCETNMNQIQVFNKKGKMIQKVTMPYPVTLDVDGEGKLYMTGQTSVDVFELKKKFNN